MTAQFQLTCFRVLIIIQCGLAALYILRAGIPTVLRMLSAFFWGLSCGWDRLWQVYHYNVATHQKELKQGESNASISLDNGNS